MRRTVEVVIVVAIVAAACGGGDDTADTTRAPATTAENAPATIVPPTTGAPAEEVDGWDPAIADELLALESANDGLWTVDTAVDAIGILRPIFLQGVNAEAPINITRLIIFLAENFDDVPQAEWDAVIASGPVQTARLVSYQTEAFRQVYQDIAERADAEFVAVSGHRLNVPIYVALSDLDLPFDVYAATWVGSDNLEPFRAMFGRTDLFEMASEGIADLTATSGEACVIVLGQELTRWSEDRQVSGLLHEVVHCHQNVVHPLGRRGFQATDVDWMDEGYASWAGEALFGGTLNSRLWWNAYLDGGIGSRPDGFNLFQGSYRSIGFYSMLASGGVDPYVEFIPWFNGLRANGVADTARYAAMAGGADPKTIAGWTASASRNDEFGSPWNSDNGPGISSASEERRPRSERAGSEPRPFTAGPGEQRYWAVQFNTAFEEASVISISATGLGTYRWDFEGWNDQFIVDDALELAWCVGEDCTCEDGTSPVPGALAAPIAQGDRPVLHAALFGGDGQSRLVASVEPLEDACEEDPPDPGPLDPCLFGTWNPDPSQFQDLILSLYRSAGVSDLTLQGTIDLTFTDEGEFTFTYAGVRGTGTFEDDDFVALWSGGSFGTWEAFGGSMILNFSGSNIAVSVNDLPGRAPSTPPSSVDATYTCGSTSLTVDPPGTPGGQWPLPEDWTKTG